uniref:Membrane magnesium transporter n=1 Tax=Polytomella parva TaxID=51329 RepID=A0A7S0V2W8_9CHLO|mmetsp:Transcript_29081/g.53446  ORF Transcript_29081/g.53446 Transcript_29081/m.53446 type:complete len:106 (+) Transcript_29081:43-360(+)
MISHPGILTALGLSVFFHTTYAVIKYRQELKLSQESFESLPASLAVELFLAIILSSTGALLLTSPMKSINMPKKGKSMDNGTLRMDFMSFNNRSKALPLDIPPLN